MDFQILVTGRNTKVASDVCEHLVQDKGYQTCRCEPTQTDIVDKILSTEPNIVIVCLGNETDESIQVYDVLKSAAYQVEFTIFAIATDEDRQKFTDATKLKRVFFFSRPVSLLALYEKIGDIQDEKERKKKEKLSCVREFVNDKDTDGRRRKQILVVDDDPQQLMQIRQQLDEFYDVTLVKSGEAAFKYLLKKTMPDLVLLDYMMPGEDGPSVLLKMRLNDAYAKIPVIFLTGVTEKEAILKVISELHPQGYIVKPAKKSELVAKIIDVLG